MSVLRAERLKKRYKARTVVKDVSLEVASGEVVGLLGPNGAGKTTCFYMMVGMVPLDGGELSLDDKNLTHLPIHRRARMGLSYLPQEASIFRKLTVSENIRAVLELRELDSEQIDEQLDVLLNDLHIIPDQDRAETDKPATLTEGNSTVDSVGLEFDKQKDSLKLLSQVKAHYVLPKRQPARPAQRDR
jgi:ABC-type lipopolysaccharide export system ATPase subunit